MDNSIKKLVIIGSGPAGLTAGIYAARANLEPVIIDGSTPGGQLMSTAYVENWPGEKKISGPQLMRKMREHAQEFKCTFISESVEKIDTQTHPFTITTNKNNKIKTLALIIATGAKPKQLKVPGEKEYWGKGVSSCAVCDGAFYKDKPVVIVGGGDTAMENASFMTNFTDQVTVVHILDKLTASKTLQKRVLTNPKIKVIYSSAVTEIHGDEKHVTQITVVNKATNEQQSLKTEAVFVSIGLKPSTEFLKGVVDLDDWGYIKIWQNRKLGHTSTSVDGIFAAGDAYDYMYKQAITASGMGCMAALDAEQYIEGLARQ